MNRSRASRRGCSPSRRSRSALLQLCAAVGLAAAGCAYHAPSVPVTGSRVALDALSGEWEGEYSSDATGRSGSIHFALRSATDSAFGEVVMVPAGATRPLVRANATDAATAAPAAPATGTAATATEVLSIRFVRADGGTVTGSLDPYRSPECDCILTTRFTGQQDGDRIAGTFVTTGDPVQERQTGRWQVTRPPR